MNSNYISIIEKLGYKVFPNNNISLINIFDQSNNELEKRFDYANGDVLFVTFTSKDGQEIRIFTHPFVTIKVNDKLFVSAYQYNGFDTYNEKHDHEIHDAFYIDVNILDERYSIIIELNKIKDGLNSVDVNTFHQLKNHRWHEMYEQCGDKLSIRQTPEGAIVNIVGNNRPLYSIDYNDCTKDNYKDIIVKHINDIDTFKDNNNVKEALSMILPSMELLIDELIDDWKANNNKKVLRK